MVINKAYKYEGYTLPPENDVYDDGYEQSYHGNDTTNHPDNTQNKVVVPHLKHDSTF